MVGRVFGRLTVLADAGRTKGSKKIWLCRCECGKKMRSVTNQLTSGKTRSCGCLRSDMLTQRYDALRKTIPDRYRELPNGCWQWTGNTNRDGYGSVRYGDKGQSRAHRITYEQRVGPIPAGMVVMHTCDNPACINPKHLKLGTQADNMRDMARKHRRKGINTGAENGAAKLTREQACEIRRRYAEGNVSQQALGYEYGVAQTTISRVVLGRSFANDLRGRP